MKFLANENSPLASVRALRNIGLDVVSVEEESPGISDEEVLRRARDENRIIVTFDRDYAAWSWRVASRPRIVIG